MIPAHNLPCDMSTEQPAETPLIVSVFANIKRPISVLRSISPRFAERLSSLTNSAYLDYSVFWDCASPCAHTTALDQAH